MGRERTLVVLLVGLAVAHGSFMRRVNRPPNVQ